MILAAGAIAIASLGINFGIDFESGTRITTPLERPASVQDVRDTLGPLGYSDAKIQEVDDPELGNNVVQIAVSQLEPQRGQQGRAGARRRLRREERRLLGSSSIGPTFGEQIARTAAIAIIASLILISIYIGVRFEFKFAVPVLIALAHDLLITTGVYALTDREVTTSTVAALLTILGYSLYDTVIVFDRIRENVPRMPRATFSQIANRSMSEVFTRSLATSFVVLMPVGSLLLFGGDTLKDFAFALLVGVASGAYSSIFIATPVLVEWKEREDDLHAPAPSRHGGERRGRAPVRVRDDRRARGGGRRRAARAARRPPRPAPAHAGTADRRDANRRHRGGASARGAPESRPGPSPSRSRSPRPRSSLRPTPSSSRSPRPSPTATGRSRPRRAGRSSISSTAGSGSSTSKPKPKPKRPRKKHGRR